MDILERAWVWRRTSDGRVGLLLAEPIPAMRDSDLYEIVEVVPAPTRGAVGEDSIGPYFDVPHVMLTDHERENVVAAYYAGVEKGKAEATTPQGAAVSPERINAAIDAAVLACEQADGGRSGRSAALRRELETKLRPDQQAGAV